MLSQLHFIEPLWLLTIIPLALILWLVSQIQSDSKAWEKVIDANLLPFLLQGKDSQTGKLAMWLLAISWLISVLALADPVWEKIPRPVFQTNTARVIVLDLSNSMLIDDLKPSRLARARFKIEDILSQEEEGQTGLVLFAGDAFTASPLTRDSETIRSLLKVLTPRLMPVQGSRVDLGLQKAHGLLKQAGVFNGQVLLIADGISDQNTANKIAQELKADTHTVSVLGVGTETGGTLPQLNYQNGEAIRVKLEAEALQEIAKNGGGNYHLISTNNADLHSVLSKAANIKGKDDQNKKTEDLKSDEWKSSGPFLVLLLLPLAALAFRRGWLFNIFIAISLVGVLGQPEVAIAYPLEQQWKGLWQNLYQNREQQADKALKQQQYEKASELSSNPLRKGSAEYKKKDYQKALENFKQAQGADARYNEGNALAKLEKYKEAIEAYEKALKQQPDMEDAKANKATIEELLKKQQEQKNNQKNSDEPQNQQEKQDNQQKDNQQESKDNNQQQQDGAGEDKKNSTDKNEQEKQQQSKKADDKENQFSDANKQLEKEKNADKQEKPDNTKSAKEQDDQEDKAKETSESKEVKEEATDKKNNESNATDGTKTEPEELNEEEKMAAEQWLRRIPDDPGGLLRRKFQSQYQKRRRLNNSERPW